MSLQLSEVVSPNGTKRFKNINHLDVSLKSPMDSPDAFDRVDQDDQVSRYASSLKRGEESPPSKKVKNGIAEFP